MSVSGGHGAQALQACLESLRAQESPPPFELLIGGDPSPEALAVVGELVSDAQFCRTGQMLPGAARNPLIERARESSCCSWMTRPLRATCS